MGNLNERIKLIRQNTKLTQNQFGEKLAVSGSYVSRIESGKEQPTEMLLKLIALTFNISTEWLEKGIGTMQADKEEFDYFERGNLEVYKKDLSNTFDNILMLINNTHPDFPVEFFLSASMSSLYDTIKKLSLYPSVGIMIFERITNINLEICNQIEYILKFKNTSKNYEMETYKHLLLLSKSINLEIQEMNDLIIKFSQLSTNE